MPPNTTQYATAADILAELERRIAEEGLTERAWATKHNFHPHFLNGMRRGREQISKRLALHLGYHPVESEKLFEKL
jgi:hypothetical protein